ncbi:hypothetical protein ACP4OV_020422 [Aristida adscensionis]
MILILPPPTLVVLPPTTDHVIEVKDTHDWIRKRGVKEDESQLSVYEFYVQNSATCKVMRKPFEEFAKKFKDEAKFYKFDVDKFAAWARDCGVEAAYPTYVLCKDGNILSKVIGAKEELLRTRIEEALRK